MRDFYDLTIFAEIDEGPLLDIGFKHSLLKSQK